MAVQKASSGMSIAGTVASTFKRHAGADGVIDIATEGRRTSMHLYRDKRGLVVGGRSTVYDATAQLRAADANKDGSVTRKELTAYLKQFDKDGNGSIQGNERSGLARVTTKSKSWGTNPLIDAIRKRPTQKRLPQQVPPADGPKQAPPEKSTPPARRRGPILL